MDWEEIKKTERNKELSNEVTIFLDKVFDYSECFSRVKFVDQGSGYKRRKIKLRDFLEEEETEVAVDKEIKDFNVIRKGLLDKANEKNIGPKDLRKNFSIIVENGNFSERVVDFLENKLNDRSLYSRNFKRMEPIDLALAKKSLIEIIFHRSTNDKLNSFDKFLEEDDYQDNFFNFEREFAKLLDKEDISSITENKIKEILLVVVGEESPLINRLKSQDVVNLLKDIKDSYSPVSLSEFQEQYNWSRGDKTEYLNSKNGDRILIEEYSPGEGVVTIKKIPEKKDGALHLQTPRTEKVSLKEFKNLFEKLGKTGMKEDGRDLFEKLADTFSKEDEGIEEKGMVDDKENKDEKPQKKSKKERKNGKGGPSSEEFKEVYHWSEENQEPVEFLNQRTGEIIVVEGYDPDSGEVTFRKIPGHDISQGEDGVNDVRLGGIDHSKVDFQKFKFKRFQRELSGFSYVDNDEGQISKDRKTVENDNNGDFEGVTEEEMKIDFDSIDFSEIEELPRKELLEISRKINKIIDHAKGILEKIKDDPGIFREEIEAIEFQIYLLNKISQKVEDEIDPIDFSY